MEYLVLLGLLLIKHVVLSSVLDIGYSKSRNLHFEFPFLAFVLQTALELSVTVLLLLRYGWPAVMLSWIVETLALGFGCWLERRATLQRLLWYHLTGEGIACFAYGVITALVFYST